MSETNNQFNSYLEDEKPTIIGNMNIHSAGVETDIEQIRSSEYYSIKRHQSNDKPPLDPFIDEINDVKNSKKTPEVVVKLPEDVVLDKSKASFFKHKYLFLGVVSLIIIVVVTIMYFNSQYELVKKWDELVYPGVTINGRSYSSITEDDLISALEEDFGREMNSKTITIKSSIGKDNIISFDKLKPEFNIKEVADEAFNFMKNKDFFSKVNQILGKGRATLPLVLKCKFSETELEKFVEATAKDLKKDAVDASIKIEDNTIKRSDEINGQTLKNDEMLKVLKEKVEEFNYNNIEVDAIVDTILPKVTRTSLIKINGILSSSSFYKYQYNYNTNIFSNIEIVSNRLNGKLIYPGDEFSFNETIGDPAFSETIEGFSDGKFKLVKKMVNGIEVEDYFGISEAATVLFDSLLKAGIVPTERCKADEPIDYTMFGLEAIIKYGIADLKFKNNFESPIYIQSETENGKLAINIYSNVSELKNSIYTPVVKSEKGQNLETIYIEDESLDAGASNVIQTGLPSQEVTVFLKIQDASGNITEKELYKQYYTGRPEKIRRGIKQSQIQIENSTSNSTNGTTVKTTTTRSTTTTTTRKTNVKRAIDQLTTKVQDLSLADFDYPGNRVLQE